MPSSSNGVDRMEDEDHHEGLLTDVGFMFDACIEKVTCRFEYGAKVSILLSYVQQEPGAMQSGHYVWPAAPALCEYLESHEDAIPNGSIVELGSGCGLTGLAVAQLKTDATVIFTDHDPGVLKTIEHNVQQQERPQAKCLTQSLRWGPDGAEEIKALEGAQGSGERSTDMIVGSDVIYAREIVPLLFWTVDRLLTPRAGAVFLMCSSFGYDDNTEAEIDAQCAKFGFERTVIHCSLDQKGSRIQEFARRQL